MTLPSSLQVAQNQAAQAIDRATALRNNFRGRSTYVVPDDVAQTIAKVAGPLKMPLDQDLQVWLDAVPEVEVTAELIASAQIIRLLRALLDVKQSGAVSSVAVPQPASGVH